MTDKHNDAIETIHANLLDTVTGGWWRQTPPNHFRFDQPGEPKLCDSFQAGPPASLIATPGVCGPGFSLKDSQEVRRGESLEGLQAKFPGVK